MTVTILLTVIFLLAGPPSPGGSSVPLEWEAVDGAVAYMLDIESEAGERLVSRRVDGTNLSVQLSEGRYRIRVGVINRFDRVEVFTDWVPLRVERPRMPYPGEPSVNSAARGQRVKGIRLPGRDLVAGARVYLKNDGTVINGERCVAEGEMLTFDLSTGDSPAGDYTVIVENPGGLSAQSAGRFRITEKPPSVPWGITLQAGWICTVVAGPWSDVYGPSFAGASLTAGYLFSRSSFLPGVPFAGQWGAEVEVDYILHESRPRTSTVDTTMNRIMAGLNLAALRPLASSLGLVFRLGGGVAYSLVAEDRTFGQDRSYGSTDAFARAGAGLLWHPGAHFRCEFRVDYCPVFYSGQIYHGLQMGLSAGTTL